MDGCNDDDDEEIEEEEYDCYNLTSFRISQLDGNDDG